MSNFLFCYDFLFGEDLHGIDTFSVLLTDLKDFSKGSSSDKLEELKVTGSQGSFCLWNSRRLEGTCEPKRDGPYIAHRLFGHASRR